MAKGAYIGVEGVARKVKKIYTGVETEITIPKELHFPDDFSESVISLIPDSTGEIITDVVNTSGYYYSGSKIYLHPIDTLDSSELILARYSGETIKILKISFDVIQSPILSSNSSSDPAYVTIRDSQNNYLKQEITSVPMHIDLEETLTSNQDNPVRIGIGNYDASPYDQQAIIDNFSVELEDITENTTQSVARKVKKGYVGVGGVARPFFSSDGLEYYGVIDPLSEARSRLAATTVGNYALFGGGYTQNEGHYDTVDAYNPDLTRSTPTSLSLARSYLAATTVGDYALFGGGLGRTRPQEKKTVDAYDRNLTRTSPSMELVAGREYLAAATVGNYALFGGGYDGSPSDIIDIYDNLLVANKYINLSQRKHFLGATTVGNYALFGGGYTQYSKITDTVDAYDSTLTRSTPTVLSEARARLAATTVGDYALFGGGIGDGYRYTDAVDAYDSTLTRSTPTSLSLARYALAATTVGDYALFGGGVSESSGINKCAVDAYDNALTRSTPTGLDLARNELAATTVGDYALFGGGYASASYIDIVDAYYQEDASKISARIGIISNYATGEYSFYLIDQAKNDTIITEIIVDGDYKEVTLIPGHKYTFRGTSPSVTTSYGITDISVVTQEYKNLRGFFGNSDSDIFVSPELPKNELTLIVITIDDLEAAGGGSDWG